ncbi:MAG: transcription termination/antitermination NusG family protein [Pseudomonadota bacterium]
MTHDSYGLAAASTERWYVARTLHHKEAVAVANLQLQGFETFSPKLEATIKHARKLLTVKRSAFPRYVFVSIDVHSARWRSINGTHGVDQLLCRGGKPEAVKPGVVETLMQSTGSDGVLTFSETLGPGDTVRLISGPFAGQLGTLKAMRAKGRVEILLGLLGQETRAEVDRRVLVSTKLQPRI